MNDDPDRILDDFERHGALIRDSHFIYTSGRHGPCYVNKDAIYPHPLTVSRICACVASRFMSRSIEVVAGPAISGVILAQRTATYLGLAEDRDVLAVYAEKAADGTFELRRGHTAIVAGRRVLVVEDILTTGGTLRGVIAAVKATGGIVAGACALINRGGITAGNVGSDVGLEVMATLALESYPADDCPLCRSGVPIDTTVGKGREFLAGRRRV